VIFRVFVDAAFLKLEPSSAHSGGSPLTAMRTALDMRREFSGKPNSLLILENVSNLVCPSEQDLGEALVVLSVTEGYESRLNIRMFLAADLMLINKTELLPYVDFDVARCMDYARRVNPDICIIQLSSIKGDNFSEWIDWLTEHVKPDIDKKKNVGAPPGEYYVIEES
jgi:hydrogenase accessory protein HypB